MRHFSVQLIAWTYHFPLPEQRFNCFASSDPHHGIQFIPSDILSGIPSGNSIWHVFWHSIWQIFWHSIWQIFWHSIWHIFWHSILSGIFSGILYGFVSGRWGPEKSGEAHSAQTLAGWSPAMPTVRRISPVEVRRGPQRSDSRRLKSGKAHSAPNLAGWSPARPTALRLSPVEVRRGPLWSRAGRRGPARLTAIKSWQMMSGEDHCDQDLADEVRRGPLRSRAGRWGPARRRKEEGGWRRRRRSRASDIKSNNLHLARGEKTLNKNKLHMLFFGTQSGMF